MSKKNSPTYFSISGERDGKSSHFVTGSETGNYNTLISNKLSTLIELIPVGKKNAIKAADLAKILNVDKRSIRTLVHILRADTGAVIISGRKGYWLPENNLQGYAEVNECYHKLRCEAKSTLKAASALKKYLRQCPYQLKIDSKGE